MKVLILQPRADDGCTWYRLAQFASVSTENEWNSVHFLDLSLGDEVIERTIAAADAYILRLNSLTAFEIFDLIDPIKTGKPFFVDIDDSFEDIDPLSDMYRAYGQRNVQLSTGQYLWEDGVNINLEENRNRAKRYGELLSKCSAVIVTTFELAAFARKYNPAVVVIPNAIDFRRWPQVTPKDKPSNEVRIVWGGGSTHFPDLMEIAEPLAHVLQRNPQVKLHMVGVAFGAFVKKMPEGSVVTHPWVKSDGHGFHMASIGADIGLAPLKDMSFNYFKSSVKMYEYSALGIPTLARNIPPYNQDIVDGQNGLLYSNAEEFITKLEQLITNPIQRVQLGQAALKYVQDKRNIQQVAKDWSTFISEVVKATDKPNPNNIRITHHKDFTIEPLKGMPASRVLKMGCKRLKKQGIKHWLSAGTILGLYRDKRLIEHDTDLDVGVLSDVNRPFLAKLGGFDLVRTMYYKDLPMQSAFKREGVIFDIYYFYTGIKEDVAINYNEHGIFEKPLKFVENLSTIEFDGNTYPIPSPIDDYLEYRYGKWQTPKTDKDSWEKDTSCLKSY